jgi:hypothetical protein
MDLISSSAEGGSPGPFISHDTMLVMAGLAVCILLWAVVKQWWDGNAWKRHLRRRSTAA